ncbi:Hypothetical leucine rich repeat protein [Ectocarpus siliculosus]|uniref:Hypothetical leucine rich repeat protein n=1 Tax=Ectocarpus siliculosus TaxID=2880 RepID=D8LFJ9_ECTSI|nr:Hypothetical leucine rich repeat protein [Ectocarpus siliculosus]|eukprot:CBN79919.1 Hypothetical leucine rich repeat protein [Ectocarpus siliculosus]
MIHFEQVFVFANVANFRIPRPPYTMAQTDREALVALYTAIGGAKWRNNRNWNTSAALSQWHGVEVNSQGRVVNLFLWDNNLQGRIPTELGNLHMLDTLWLANNKLSGTIPAELRNLTALQTLSLNVNELSGPIPSELGNLAALRHLDLGANLLSGAIPAHLGALKKLTWLNLSVNQLSGAIPPQLGKLAALRRLNLRGNQLSGSSSYSAERCPSSDGMGSTSGRTERVTEQDKK